MQPYKHELGLNTKNTKHSKNKNAFSGYYAELIVMQDLLKRGFHPFLATAFPMAYDILCDTENKILRVSVKSTMQHRRFSTGGKICAVFKIQEAHKPANLIDIYALVDLPANQIYYMEYSAVKDKTSIYVSHTTGVIKSSRASTYQPYQLIRTNEWFKNL